MNELEGLFDKSVGAAGGKMTEETFADGGGMERSADAGEKKALFRGGGSGGAVNELALGLEEARDAVGLLADGVIHVVGMGRAFVGHDAKFPFERSSGSEYELIAEGRRNLREDARERRQYGATGKDTQRKLENERRNVICRDTGGNHESTVRIGDGGIVLGDGRCGGTL